MEEEKKSKQLTLIALVLLILLLLLATGVGLIYFGISKYIENVQQVKTSAVTTVATPTETTATSPTLVEPTGTPRVMPSETNKPEEEQTAIDQAKVKGSVQFQSQLADFIKTSRVSFKVIDQALEGYVTFMDQEVAQPGWEHLFDAVSKMSTDSNKQLQDSDLKAPKSYSAKDQEFFNSRIETIKTESAELMRLSEELKDYYQTKAYEGDWHKKFLVSRAKMDDLMNDIDSLGDEMLEYAKEPPPDE